MLAAFSFENFRFVESCEMFYMIDKDSNDLKSSVICGANGVGKTTFIDAIRTMLGIINDTSLIKNLPNTDDNPLTFKVGFTIEDKECLYSFSCTSKRFIDEYVDIFHEGCCVGMINIVYSDSGYEYTIDNIDSDKIHHIKHNLDDKSLILNEFKDIPFLDRIYSFFHGGILIGDTNNPTETMRLINESESEKKRLLDLFRYLDIDIESIEDNSFIHQNERIGRVSYDHESSGIKKLFCLYYYISQAYQTGKTLFVDDLDSNLHPLVVEYLIKLFNTKECKGQLIFTSSQFTHAFDLIRQGVLNTDSVWLIGGKDFDIFSIADFKEDDGQYQRNYFQGRYCGIPIIIDSSNIFED